MHQKTYEKSTSGMYLGICAHVWCWNIRMDANKIMDLLSEDTS